MPVIGLLDDFVHSQELEAVNKAAHELWDQFPRVIWWERMLLAHLENRVDIRSTCEQSLGKSLHNAS